MNAKTENQAEHNALSWADTIIEMYQAHQALDAGDVETVEIDGEEFTDADEIRERASASVLEVQVRGSWYAPGDTDARDDPAEFYILLSTGGPALRIVGDLDRGQPERPRLQYQDWGTPWTDSDPDADDWDEAVSWFVNCFYFGE